MEISVNDKYCIITPLSETLDIRQTERLIGELEFHKTSRVGIDLSYVQDCTFEFIDNIKNFCNIGIFNISSDISALLISMGLDKKLNLFVSEMDFIDDRRRLLNRKFCRIK